MMQTACPATETVDLITMGRIGVDLYPERTGASLRDARTFAKALGGTATNVAVAAARLGCSAAVVTKVGEDPFGEFCRAALRGYGVSTRWVGTESSLRTPLTFCEVHPPDDFPLLFYREPTAPDLELRVDELDMDAVTTVPVLWTTGTGLSREPSRTTTLTALDARGADEITIHDLDDRPMLWERPDERGRWAREAVRRASVVVGNREEAAVAVGRLDDSPLHQARALLELGPRLAIVKQGGRGALCVSDDEVIEVPATATEVVCGLGAGDAFGGALCFGLLRRWPLERTMRHASAAGAIVAGSLLCSEAMPTLQEIEAAMQPRAGGSPGAVTYS